MNPSIIAVTVGLSKIIQGRTYISFVLSMIVFLTVLTIFIKIKAEHVIYEKVGQYVAKVWRYFGLFKRRLIQSMMQYWIKKQRTMVKGRAIKNYKYIVGNGCYDKCYTIDS